MVERMSIEEFRNGKFSVRKSKYGNNKTQYNGKIYDSFKESQYAKTLDTLKSATLDRDRVNSYDTQIEFRCEVGGRHICSYFADFKVYYADGRIEIIDVKSKATQANPVYRLKKKLVEALYPVKIIEV